MEATDNPILLAEADPIFGDVVEAYLVSRGYRTVRVRDGRRALDALTRERFHAIVVGLELPGLDGLEVAACAALLPARPPVVLTTSEPGLQREPVETLGIAALVLRPCRLDALIGAIKRVARPPAPHPSLARPAVPG